MSISLINALALLAMIKDRIIVGHMIESFTHLLVFLEPRKLCEGRSDWEKEIGSWF